MSNLKDTDFDDLFRRASDKYPLRTDSADWDKLAAALEKDPRPELYGGMEAAGRRRKRRFIWLLLILPLGGLGYYTWHRTGQSNPAVATAIPNPATAAPARANTTPNRVNSTAASPAVATPRPDLHTAQKAGPGATSDGDPVAASSLATSRTAPRTGRSGRLTQTSGPSVPSNTGLTGSDAAETAATGRNTGNRNTRNNGRPAAATPADAADMATTQGTNSGFAPGAVRQFSAAESFTLKWAGDMQRARIGGDYRLAVNVTAPAVEKDKEPAKQKTRTAKTSYLYAGIIGAPDISTVKMQSVKGVGTTFGLLLGYAFNSRWAVESGIYLDRKKYYTDGEYFEKTNVRLPSGSSVNGTCNMWEIPLNIRYTFNPGAKTKWFATAGFSTYLMTSEKYSYAYQWTSGGGTWNSDSLWNIKRPSQYPFSIVNLSAGFEQRLGRVGNLRVEPYVRIPLSGIGTGKLPIMSGGVNIGITRRLW